MSAAQGARRVVLRPLTQEDVPRVAQLEHELFGTLAWSEETLVAELARPDRHYLAAELPGILGPGGMARPAGGEGDPIAGAPIVGYAGVSLEPEWNVMTVGTVPWARRRGVATALLEALMAAARRAGGSELFLEVRASAAGAQRLYTAHGFTPVARRRKYYMPDGEDAVVMRVDLRPQSARRGLAGGAW